ncbi:MAG: type I glutamate--ammonia ligase [Proteobacteria bacterium]|nr:type I glutamate--ammonia ligase [Pseudomonadota bacterium]
MTKPTVSDILNLIKDKDIKFVDFRFIDYTGKTLHISYHASAVGEEELTKGVAFDGSSVPLWKDINESDMILMPHLSTHFIDPFNAAKTLVIICDIHDPIHKTRYDRDPRNTATLAEKYLQESGIGDTAYFGPEPEFFVFDDVKFQSTPYDCFYNIDSVEDSVNSGKNYEMGNMGHRSATKGSYFDLSPMDTGTDMRSEIIETLREVGVDALLHHHEVANSQYEIGFKYDTLVKTADNVQKFKYVVQNVAHAYGRTATFMPKPIYGDNGSGMHVHQSIWKDGKPLFLNEKTGGLSETALYYIGGIIKHAKALNAFTNPSTNSYKRLVPGFEAPTLLAYSGRNRSASIRIPHVTNPKGTRIEARFPDPAANAYLAFSAMLMAGIDGIKNKIHPGEADNRDLYSLPDSELKKVPTVATTLREALDHLDNNRDFLKQGNVFTDNHIDAYLKLKRREVKAYEERPHPIEFAMYYNC